MVILSYFYSNTIVFADNRFESTISSEGIQNFGDVTSEWLELRGDTPTGTRWMLYENYGGFWADTEKDPGAGDDLLCWAATASNMLEWSGWGYVDNMSHGSTDDFFQFFQDHVTDKGSAASYGLEWWLSGTLHFEDDEWSQEDVDHSGFWNSYTPQDYIWYWRDPPNILPEVRAELILGKAVGLGIKPVTGGGGHAVTVWGYNYDESKTPADTDYYLGVWISDSDSHKDTYNPPDVLKYYALAYDHDQNFWYMPSYGPYDGWYISSVAAIAVFPGANRPTAEGGPYTGVEGTPIVFDASSSTDPDGDLLEHRWDFNSDGIWDTDWTTGPYEKIFYDDYHETVMMEVFDGRLRDVHFTTIDVENVGPKINIGSDRTVDEGTAIPFSVSIEDPGIDTHTIFWDFGDGSTTTTEERYTSHTYIADGTYELHVQVTDDDGGFISKSIHIYVQNVAPTADAGPDQTVNQGDIVQFTGDYQDAGNDVSDYWWDFGDGSGIVSGELNPTHTYYGETVYTATFTVIDSQGEEGIDTVEIKSLNVAPVVDLGPDITGIAGEEVTFNGDFYDPGLEGWEYWWEFGDGAIIVTDSLSPSHVYNDTGIYTVKLTVSDNFGGAGSDTLTLTIERHVPLVDAGPDQTVNQGDIVYFSGSFIDEDSTSWTRDWDFDDGGIIIRDELEPTRIFYGNRVYTVTLTVTDDDGNIGTDTVEITVQNVDPTVYAGEDVETFEGLEITFAGVYEDPGVGICTYLWDFGDGSPQVTTLETIHTYNDDDTYTVTLTVTDNFGGQGTDTLEVIVNNVAPTITTFEMTQPDPNYILPVVHTLDFTGTYDDQGIDDLQDIAYSWDFGDGSVPITDTLTPQHIYDTPGVYIVTFTVQDDDGGIDTRDMTITVNSPVETNQLLSTDIQDVPDEFFVGKPEKRKKAFDNMFNALDNMLEEGNYTEMISFLTNNIRVKVDGYVDGSKRNDWICDELNQIELCKIIDDYINYLQTLIPTKT